MIIVNQQKMLMSTESLEDLHGFAVKKLGIEESFGLFHEGGVCSMPYYDLESNRRKREALRQGAQEVDWNGRFYVGIGHVPPIPYDLSGGEAEPSVSSEIDSDEFPAEAPEQAQLEDQNYSEPKNVRYTDGGLEGNPEGVRMGAGSAIDFVEGSGVSGLNDELDEERRYGRFWINRQAIKSAAGELRKLMAHMIIVRAEIRDFGRGIEYDAISDLFGSIPKTVPESAIETPYYKIIINADDVTAFPCGRTESQVLIVKYEDPPNDEPQTTDN